MPSPAFLQRFFASLLVIAPALLAQNNIAVLSSAGGTSTISPGSLATAYLTLDTVSVVGQPDQFGNFPTDLGGFSLNVSGTRAQLLFVGASQINFLVPSDIQPGDAQVTVGSNQMVARGTASIRPVAPSIFTMVANGREMGSVLNAVTFRGGPFPPETSQIQGCDTRTRLALFTTGIGLAASRVRARDVHVEAQDSTGAVYNLEVAAAVPAPGIPSVEQINVTLASGMHAGTILLRVIANGVASNRVQVDLAARDGEAPSGACLGQVSVDRADAGGFNGSVSLAWPAPAGGVTVQLTSADPSVMVPASVVVSAGKLSANFPVAITGTQVPKQFGVSAVIGGDARTGNIGGGSEMRSSSFEEGPSCVDGVSFAFPGIVSGYSLTARVSLTDPAPPEGATVSLLAINGGVSVSPKITVPAGQTSTSFSIDTAPASSPAPATVIATGSCGGSSGVLNVVLTPCIAAVSLAATSVAGGSANTGTVTLNAPALAGGQIVDLRSNDPGVMIDSQVRVLEGQISASFPIKTSSVNSSKQANILGSVGNCGAASASMTVNPQ